MHIAQKFKGLLEKYRRPDGRKWSGQEIDEATGGVVSRSYVTNLRKGRIENPGYAKLAAIKQRLSNLADDVLAGAVDRGDAAVVGQILNTYLRACAVELKAREQLELVERLAALEEGLRDNKGRSSRWRA
jgi:hypothetical protein